MNVLELLNLKGVDYKDTGGDILIKCLNPEHDDSHPSMRIDRETGVFHCLSCGFGKGIPSIFHFYNEGGNRQSIKLIRVRRMIKDIITSNRSLEIPESAQPFEDDYRDIDASIYKKYNAFIHETDWPGRIVFPITDSTGRIVVFIGRSRQSSAPPKYLIQPKDSSAPLFPIRYNKPQLWLTEGLFDMLNLEDKGIDYAVACFGTQQFTPDNVQDKLMPFIISGTNVVVILLDNDKAGLAAANKIARMIREKTRLVPYIANHLLPEGEDPGSLTQEQVDELAENINKFVAEQDNSAI